MTTVLLSEPILATCGFYEGPWQVVLHHPTDYENWYIFNVETRRYKKIGRVGARRTNYYVQAVDEANYRNAEHQLKLRQEAIERVKISGGVGG